MSAPPKLSVGLPIYNSEKYLAEAIEALLGQTYADFELIISDNASTDGTPDICHHYESLDSRVRYFRQPRNIGLAPNHNFVADQARGEYFKWAAGDDLYGRDLLARCVAALDEYPAGGAGPLLDGLHRRSSQVTQAFEYPLSTTSLRAPGAVP